LLIFLPSDRSMSGAVTPNASAEASPPDPGHDVAVLVAPGDLERAVGGAAQVEEVVGLENHVAELGVADPLLAGMEALPHRVLLDHHVDGEVLADVAQHVDETKPVQPVQVVDQHRRVGPGLVEVEQALEDPALAGHVGLHLLAVHEHPLGVPPGGVTDEAGASAHDHDGLVAGPLPVHEQFYGDQVADVQAVGGGVEAAVADTRGPGQVPVQLLAGGPLMQQPPPRKLVEERHLHTGVRHRHRVSL
jgi:hypothetical protein